MTKDEKWQMACSTGKIKYKATEKNSHFPLIYHSAQQEASQPSHFKKSFKTIWRIWQLKILAKTVVSFTTHFCSAISTFFKNSNNGEILLLYYFMFTNKHESTRQQNLPNFRALQRGVQYPNIQISKSHYPRFAAPAAAKISPGVDGNILISRFWCKSRKGW